jgi:hypothetical protein
MLDQMRTGSTAQAPGCLTRIAGILAPLASTNRLLEVLEQIEPIMGRRRGAANNAAGHQSRANAANTVSGA